MFLTAVLAVVLLASVSYAGVAGVFRLPYDPYQQWPSCASSTMGWKVDQIFMEKSSRGYHPAEDWNGKCGGSTDRGAMLYAVADGVVEDAQQGVLNSSDQGGFLLIRHPLPDRTSRYILYEHILDIEVNPRTGTQFKIGDVVYIDDTVARLGDGNGYYTTLEHCVTSSSCAHLHLEMRRSLFAKLTQTPYYPTLSPQTALLYSSPSLFIDDRSNAVVQNLVQGQWTYFMQRDNAPASTAFVEYSGDRFSLFRAANLGLIYGMMYQWKNNAWQPYGDINQVFFEAGYWYAIYSFYGGTRLNTLAPGHNFKEDRAKIDMIRAVSTNPNFTSVQPDDFRIAADTSTYSHWYMPFTYNNGSGNQIAYANQFSFKSNPLVRYTAYYDPATGSWTPWTQVNWNTLD